MIISSPSSSSSFSLNSLYDISLSLNDTILIVLKYNIIGILIKFSSCFSDNDFIFWQISFASKIKFLPLIWHLNFLSSALFSSIIISFFSSFVSSCLISSFISSSLISSFISSFFSSFFSSIISSFFSSIISSLFSLSSFSSSFSSLISLFFSLY